MANMTCKGEPVSSYYPCIYKGTLCSGNGECLKTGCICRSNFTGDYCQTLLQQSTSGVPLTPILATILPVTAVALLLLTCLIIGAFVCSRRATHQHAGNWEIDLNELELGEQIGGGAYGEVYKAMWKGTEVAAKMIISTSLIESVNVSREMVRNFKEEVRVMTALRHPNVVLFMAACTQPPKLCIVMEFMALGSLFDVSIIPFFYLQLD